MDIKDTIQHFLSEQAEPKQTELRELHQLLLRFLPDGKLWFDNGINSDNKVVCNPVIGYGQQTLHYANGTTKDFFQIGISATKTGISVYLIGLKDKKYLSDTFQHKIGKAKISGYCIAFKTIKDIDMAVLETIISYGIAAT